MRILVLSFYYHPDLSAGSFRATSLVSALRERSPLGTQIDVVTSLPNRYHSFTQEAAEFESVQGLEIYRIKLPVHRGDIAGQSRAFAHFVRRALAHVASREYDLVFATSSRLMTAALGTWIARRKRAPLYLDIRDIFVDTIKDVMPGLAAWPARRIFAMLEWWTMRRANHINLVSRGFEGYFKARYGDRSFSWFTNGIDDEFLAMPEPSVRVPLTGPVTFVYAGNMGEGQGLHYIVPQLALALGERVRFILIGDGGRREALEAALRDAGIKNVELRPPVPRAQLIDLYRMADVLFLHLGAHAAFEKVLPSKLFEYAALGKPMLAGVSGYAAQFVREEIPNAAVFPPCDVSRAVSAFQSLELLDCRRAAFVTKYGRARIARDMADSILALGRSPT